MLGHDETPEDVALLVPVPPGLMRDIELLGSAVDRVPGAYALEVLRAHLYGKQEELKMLRGGHDET